MSKIVEMKYNWHTFFKRLTIVISIVSILAIGIWITVEFPTDFHPIISFFLAAIIIGCPVAIGIWIVFFVIRWIIRGLLR